MWRTVCLKINLSVPVPISMCQQPVLLNLRGSPRLLAGPSHLPPGLPPDLSGPHPLPRSEEMALPTSAALLTKGAV